MSAVSVGVIDGAPLLDLPYEEDVRAETDMNVVMTGDGRFVEVQGTAEGAPFGRDDLDAPAGAGRARDPGDPRAAAAGLRASVIYLASQNAHKAIELGRLLGTGVAPLPGYEAPVEDGAHVRRQRPAEGAGRRRRGPDRRAPSWPTTRGSSSRRSAARRAIHSARYGGLGLDDAGRVRHLLRELGDAADRRAAFVCVLVAVLPDGSERVAEGRVDGTIAPAPRGAGGFGYDPVFVPAGETRTIGELTDAEKDALSHRGRAAAALRVELAR